MVPLVRIVFVLHGFPPHHNAGAEMMAARLLRALGERGHDVLAVSRSGAGEWEGVQSRALDSISDVRDEVAAADVVFTHLNETKLAESVASVYRKPLVHVIHNHQTLTAYRVRRADLLVFNSRWLLDRCRGQLRGTPRMVVHPPTQRSHGVAEPGRAVATVNLMEAKGARLFWELADAEPDRRFIGVRGSYGKQMIPKQTRNVVVWRNRGGLDQLWPRTSVYLQPSSYESFGMTAVEALAHGVPVIACPTPGLQEALGSAAAFAPFGRLEDWRAELRRLDNPSEWDRRSQASLDRAGVLRVESSAQVDELSVRLVSA